MSTVSEAPVEFDPFSSEFFDDPYDLYRRMRDHAPVYFNEKYGFWALFRYEDVCRAHKEWQTFSSSHGVDLSTLSKPPELIRQLHSIIMMDPPEHDRLRALVSRVFTPRAVTSLEPMIREVITSFLEPFDDAEAVRRGGRLQRAVPRRDHLEDARGPRGRSPADPPLARHRPAPRARADGPDPRGDRGAHPELGATSTSWSRTSVCIPATT